jgi:hypothetical protein
MESQYFGFEFTDVHKYVVWVPAPDEASARARLEDADDPDLETKTVSRDVTMKELRAPVSSCELPQPPALNAGQKPLASDEPRRKRHTTPEQTKPEEGHSEHLTPPDPSVTIDERVKHALAGFDDTIRALRRNTADRNDVWRARREAALQEANALLVKIMSLQGKLFTSRANLISQAGVRRAAARVRTRIERLEALSS